MIHDQDQEDHQTDERGGECHEQKLGPKRFNFQGVENEHIDDGANPDISPEILGAPWRDGLTLYRVVV